MKRSIPVIGWWLAVGLWLAVIFAFSHQPELKSDFEPAWDFVFRKIAHMAEYFVLAYLLTRAMLGHQVRTGRATSIAVILAVGYAGFDEWHQSWIRGRVGNPIDVGIDSIGAVTFAILNFFRR